MDAFDFVHSFSSTGTDTVLGWLAAMVIIFVVAITILTKKRSTELLDFVSNNLMIISFTVWFLGVILYMFGLYNEKLNWVYVIPSAIISAFKMFLVIHDYSRVQPFLREDVLYMSLFSIVHFCAAFISFLFLFKMVGFKIRSSLRIMLYRWIHTKESTIHLFWDINEPSFLLAEDIKKNRPQDTVIFVDIDEDNDDISHKKTNMSHIINSINVSSDDIKRLDAIGALADHCYNGPWSLSEEQSRNVFDTMQLYELGKIIKKTKKCNFYFLSDNEGNNIAGAFNLKRDYRLSSKGKDDVVIYIHARKDIDMEVYGHYSQFEYSKEGPKMKIVDSSYLSVAMLKRGDNTLPVNCVEPDKKSGAVETPFTALVIGFGNTGREAFKFLYEFSTFIGSNRQRIPFKCYAIDEKMDKIAGLVRGKMPAIGADELELIKAPVDSDKFWETIGKIIDKLNYVVISINNDNQGLALAANIYSYALQHRPAGLPSMKIAVRCYESANERRMKEIITSLNDSVEGDAVEMILFGQEKDIYSCELILADSIMSEAMAFNAVYENSTDNPQEQWNRNFGALELKKLILEKGLPKYHAICDINRRVEQNISNSMHSRSKLVLLGIEDGRDLNKLQRYADITETRKKGMTNYECDKDEEAMLINCAIVEHERWIASHKLMGYLFNENKDYVKKYHNCIVPWELLSEETKSYDCNVVDTTIRMAYKKN